MDLQKHKCVTVISLTLKALSYKSIIVILTKFVHLLVYIAKLNHNARNYEF
jgi:hypothetical protein